MNLHLDPRLELWLRNLKVVFLVLLTAWALAVNLTETFFGKPPQSSVQSEVSFIVNNLMLTYGEKMSVKYGHYYDAMRLVVDNTAADAKILLPAVMDRGGMTTYFLYPRKWEAYSDPFTWGNNPAGTFALIEGALSSKASAEVVQTSRVVNVGENMILIVLAGSE